MTITHEDHRTARLTGLLLSGIDGFADRLAERINEVEDAYRDNCHLGHDQLRSSCLDNLHSMVSQLGRATLDLRVPRATGRFKAEHGVPLSAVMHAYRLGGRFLWECVLSAQDGGSAAEVSLAAPAVWAISDAFTDAVAESYREAVADRARQDRRTRAVLLSTLLRGRLDERPHLWECADALRLPQRGCFAVVYAEPEAPDPHGAPGAEEALDGLEGSLRSLGVESAWRIEGQAQVGLTSLPTGQTLAPTIELLRRHCPGRLGVSTFFSGLEQTPAAFRQARLACACAEPGSGVAAYGDSPVRLMVVSAPDSAEQAVRQVLGPVLDLPEHERDLLIETLRQWFEAGGSTAACAARLYCHRNTVTHRLRRVQELTGRCPTEPRGASEIHLALEAHRLLGGPSPILGTTLGTT